ncbi:hypothetical protein KL86DYS1_31008 [uncultured Dysgonomonas sp.]|uniref:Uncharacterized protein n=1 Tax=uncultured Dysgonomonas sp. TaxID=206096 RepID=A0A212K020_9BACT|nr:hypothetical protein KL86DYS1_31008 [uncultured Dysgonomonas sp.]
MFDKGFLISLYRSYKRPRANVIKSALDSNILDVCNIYLVAVVMIF